MSRALRSENVVNAKQSKAWVFIKLMGGKEDVFLCKMWMKIARTKKYKTWQTFSSQVIFATFSFQTCRTRIEWLSKCDYFIGLCFNNFVIRRGQENTMIVSWCRRFEFSSLQIHRTRSLTNYRIEDTLIYLFINKLAYMKGILEVAQVYFNSVQ